MGAATLQLGHSKSPYSISVTGACSDPRAWSTGWGGTARLTCEGVCMEVILAPVGLFSVYPSTIFGCGASPWTMSLLTRRTNTTGSSISPPSARRDWS